MASENHADILLLPECFITGYDFPMSYEKNIADDDIRIVKVCENAKKYKIGVVLTVKYIPVILPMKETLNKEKNLRCAILREYNWAL